MPWNEYATELAAALCIIVAIADFAFKRGVKTLGELFRRDGHEQGIRKITCPGISSPKRKVKGVQILWSVTAIASLMAIVFIVTT